jgi:hypothetical protein
MAVTRESVKGDTAGWNDCLAITDSFIEGGFRNLMG